jgi:hypothetical protein
MPGLVPGIHVFAIKGEKSWMAGTILDNPGHDKSQSVVREPQLIFMGMAPRKSRLPTSTPQWRRIA